MKPVIGITVHTLDEKSEDRRSKSYFRLQAQYARAVVESGGIPVLLPTRGDCAASPDEVVRRIQGLLLSGGSGLAGVHFETQAAPSLRTTDPERYDYEVALVRQARNHQKPMMGICRGHQTLVEALGGQLIRNVHADQPDALHHNQETPFWEPSHDLDIVEGTILFRHLGRTCRVNSFHRQSVKTLPEGFCATARSPDGLIEAVEANGPLVLGVQFHPEWLYGERPEFLNLFRELIAAAKS